MQQDYQIAIPEDIKLFLMDMIQESGMLLLDDLVKESMMQELYVRLDSFLVSKLVENLPQEKLEEFAILEEKNAEPQVIQDFLQTNLANPQEIFLEGFSEFKNMYLESYKKAQDRVSSQSTPSHIAVGAN